MSGQECSSTKVDFVCAVRVPGGVNCKGNVHGHRVRSRSHGNVKKSNSSDTQICPKGCKANTN